METFWKRGMLLLFVVTLMNLFFTSCEKTCLYYSCEVTADNGEVSYVTVNGSNANVYGLSRCHCVDEVNRYVRR